MITARRAVISLILAGCIALLVLSFTLVRPTHTPIVYKNSAVVRVFPEEGTSTLRQANVSVILASGYTLATQNTEGMSFAISGARVGIPQDEIQILPGQNQYSFSPGPGRQFSELPPGRVCVVLQIVHRVNINETPQQFSWCFLTQ